MTQTAHAREVTSPGTDSAACLCPACENAPMRIFYTARNVPTNSCILLSTPQEARAYPTGDIALGFCDLCGFVFNTAFDLAKTEYSGRYEETQAFSGTFNRFHRELAERLVNTYDLHDKDVLEIGCGKGEFLVLLAELGNNRGVGIDPGVDLERVETAAPGLLKFIPDFYSEAYGDHKVDFLACKMTLEHIPRAGQFVSTVRRGLGDQTDAVVFFQVPEAFRIFSQCAFEDIYYEHCAYFSVGSIGRMFRAIGFDALDIATEYDEQYLTIEARPRAAGAPPKPPQPVEDDLAIMAGLIETFAERSREKLDLWRSVIAEAKAAGDTIVLWGSGSKAVSFLSTLDAGADIDYVTDINPHRHNHFMPITAQRIVPPAELAAIRPGLVICMNRVYEEEIRADLAKIGLAPRIMSL